MDLTRDEAMMLLSKMHGGQTENSKNLSHDEAMMLLKKLHSGEKTASPSGMTTELPTQDDTQGQGIMPYIGALLSGGKRGIGELAYGTAGMAAQGVDKLAGTHLQGMVPKYQLQGVDKQLAQEHPITASVGSMASKIAPLLLAPEFGGSLGGQMAGQALVGGAEGAVENPDDRVKGMLTTASEAAAGPLIGKGASYAVGAGKSIANKSFKEFMGGTASEKEIETNIKALNNIGAHNKMPIGHVLASPHLKAMSSIMAYIPGSRQARDMIDIGKNIENKVSEVMDQIKPKTKESLSDTSRGFINDVKKGAQRESNRSKEKFEEIEDVARSSGVNFKKNELYNSANKAEEEIKGTDLAKDDHIKKILDSINKTETSEIYGTRKKKTESFSDALKVRRYINKALRDTPFDDQQKKRFLMSFKTAFDKDLNASAVSSGSKKIVSLLKDANKHYIEKVMPLNAKDITNFTKMGKDPDQFIQTFVKTGQYDRDVLLNKIADYLSPENKGKLAHRVINKRAKKVMGQERSNKGHILNEYMKMSDNAKNRLFTSKQKEIMDSAYTVKEMAGGDLYQLINPKTGNVWSKVAGMMGSAVVVPPILANLAVRLLKSKKLRDQYRKTINSKKAQENPENFKKLTKLIAPYLIESKEDKNVR